MASEFVILKTEKATLFHCAAFGGQSLEVAEAIVVVRVVGASDADLIIRVRKPRARKWEGWRAEPGRSSFVLVNGWEAPAAPSGFDETDPGFKKSRYGCFDARYRAEFDAFVAGDLASSGRIVGDYRAISKARVLELLEAHAQSEAEGTAAAQ